MEQPPPEATLQLCKDNKSFYKINDTEVEYLLNDRIDAVLEKV